MQAGDYSRPRLLSAGMRASRFDIRNEKKPPFNFALPKHRPTTGIEALSVQLPTLVVSRFSLISRCTHRAHAALQLIDEIDLSVQSIIGATEKRWSKLFISLIFCASSRPYKGLDRLANLARASRFKLAFLGSNPLRLEAKSS